MEPRLAARRLALPALTRQRQGRALLPQPRGGGTLRTLESDTWVPTLTLARTNCVAPGGFLDLLSLRLFICKVEIIVLTLQGFCEDEIR